VLSPECLLAGVLDIDVAVLVLVLRVELCHGSRQGDHGAPGGEQEEGGGGGDREPVPHDGGELAHDEVVRHQVLYLFNNGQRFLLNNFKAITI